VRLNPTAFSEGVSDNNYLKMSAAILGARMTGM
jgi:hypothetical protein